MKGGTILFAEMSPEIDWEDRFNNWYDTHQIPVRMAVPGFLGAQRYKDAARENYLVVYEMENEGVLDSDPFTAIVEHPNTEPRWMQANLRGYSRYIGNEISDLRRDGLDVDPLDAPILYAVFYSVPDEGADDFNGWYTEDHVPALLKCKDWLMCRRFLIEDGEPQPWTHLALHYIADDSAFDSPERAAALGTKRYERLAEEPWFQGSTLEFLRYGDPFAAAD